MNLGFGLHLLPIFCLLWKVRMDYLSTLFFSLREKKKKWEREGIVFPGSVVQSQHSSMSCQHNKAGGKLCQEPEKVQRFLTSIATGTPHVTKS